MNIAHQKYVFMASHAGNSGSIPGGITINNIKAFSVLPKTFLFEVSEFSNPISNLWGRFQGNDDSSGTGTHKKTKRPG